jgi:DNA-binding NarL/FixJ family response regulator
VITDLTMPGMSGLQVFTAIHDDARWPDLPVLLCTGAADAATVREAIAVGVRHYVVKPIKPSVIAAKVAELARPRRTAPAVVEPSVAVAAPGDAAAATAEATVAVLDRDGAEPAEAAPVLAGASDPTEASPTSAAEPAT